MTDDPDTEEARKLWAGIPGHCEPSMRAYLMRGQPVGSFLQAVLSNDLMDAAFRADSGNIAQLRTYALLLMGVFPDEAHGSRQKYNAWIESGGTEGTTGDG